MQCVCVTVYNWANGRGTIIGDAVAISEPVLTTHRLDSNLVVSLNILGGRVLLHLDRAGLGTIAKPIPLLLC